MLLKSITRESFTSSNITGKNSEHSLHYIICRVQASQRWMNEPAKYAPPFSYIFIRTRPISQLIGPRRQPDPLSAIWTGDKFRQVWRSNVVGCGVVCVVNVREQFGLTWHDILLYHHIILKNCIWLRWVKLLLLRCVRLAVSRWFINMYNYNIAGVVLRLLSLIVMWWSLQRMHVLYECLPCVARA